MSQYPSVSISLRRFLFLSALLAVAACSMGDSSAPVKKSSPSVTVGTLPYAQQLALAQLRFDQAPDNLATAMPALSKLNRYATAKPVKQVGLTTVQLNYRTGDDHKSHLLMVPLSLVGGKNADFSTLRQVTHQLAALKPEYRATHIRNVTLATREAVLWHGNESGRCARACKRSLPDRI